MITGNPLHPKGVKTESPLSCGGRVKVEITKEELEQLYLRQKLSCRKIAKRFGCNKSYISRLLKRNGIKPRTRSEESKLIVHPVKYKISKETLRGLYWDKKLSPYQIARLFGCSPGCIFNKMNTFGILLRSLEEGIALSIPRRSRSLAKSLIKYERHDFDGTEPDKAYLIGFRIGDLHVSKNKYGVTIVVSSGSSKQEQIDLLHRLFAAFGRTNFCRLSTGCFQFNCFLNESFEFLLKKEDSIDPWIFEDEQNFLAFLAGYTDAEGHFGVSKGYARFSVSSYDKNIILQISQKLNKLGVNCHPPRLSFRRGYTDKRGVRWKNDLWSLKIGKKEDLLKLTKLLRPRLKHSKRLADLITVEKNIMERNKRL